MKSKVPPPAPAAASLLEAAKEAFEKARAEVAALTREREAAVTAQDVQRLDAKEFKRAPERRALGLDYLRRHYGNRPPKLSKLEAAVEDLDEKLELAHARLKGLRVDLQRAQRDELARTTSAFKPRHREVVRKIGAALDALSAGLDEEAALRTELVRTGALQGATHESGLLDSVAALGLGNRKNLATAIFRWTRAVRERGLA